MKRTYKHPRTPHELAVALDEWYENGRGGLVRFTKVACPEAAAQADLWFEKGRARINEFIKAIEALTPAGDGGDQPPPQD